MTINLAEVLPHIKKPKHSTIDGVESNFFIGDALIRYMYVIMLYKAPHGEENCVYLHTRRTKKDLKKSIEDMNKAVDFNLIEYVFVLDDTGAIIKDLMKAAIYIVLDMIPNQQTLKGLT